MKIIGNGYSLEIVSVKRGARWAVKAVVGNEARYRPFYYKADAERDLLYWNNPPFKSSGDFHRDFMHNFNSAEELKIAL